MLSGLSRIFRKPFANVQISRKVAFAHVWQIYACGPRSCKTFHGFLHGVHIYCLLGGYMLPTTSVDDLETETEHQPKRAFLHAFSLKSTSMRRRSKRCAPRFAPKKNGISHKRFQQSKFFQGPSLVEARKQSESKTPGQEKLISQGQIHYHQFEVLENSKQKKTQI